MTAKFQPLLLESMSQEKSLFTSVCYEGCIAGGFVVNLLDIFFNIFFLLSCRFVSPSAWCGGYI